MEITINEHGVIQVEKLFNGITLKTTSGETMTICMRDSGFEFKYQGEMYFAKEGYVEPFHKSSRDNYLVDQHHQELVDIANIPEPLNQNK
jgi:hypothetical protein